MTDIPGKRIAHERELGQIAAAAVAQETLVVRADDAAGVEPDAAHRDAVELRARERRAAELDPDEPRVAQVGVVEARSGEVGAGELRAVQVRVREVHVAQVGADEAQPVQVAAVHVFGEAAADARVDQLADERIVLRGGGGRGGSATAAGSATATASAARTNGRNTMEILPYAGACAPVRSAWAESMSSRRVTTRHVRRS